MTLRELAEAARATWPRQDEATRGFAAACSPERILALLDVADAADAMPGVTPSGKARWWREDGIAGRAMADAALRAALARWHDAAP